MAGGHEGERPRELTSKEQGGGHKESAANNPHISLIKEKKNEPQRRWYQRNKEKIQERHRRYNQENKEKLNDYKRRYRQKRKEQRAADLTQGEQIQQEAIQIFPSPSKE
jgi:hypothetical protein